MKGNNSNKYVTALHCYFLISMAVNQFNLLDCIKFVQLYLMVQMIFQALAPTSERLENP